jgi:AcrR family transcriptional regulator
MPKNHENDVAPKPRRGRPRDPERYRRILEAARRHFYAHGLERASVDAIAADAGVSKMTIYSHFGSKEGLFEAEVRDRTERVVGGVAGAEALDPTQPQKALLAIGEQFLALAREDEALGTVPFALRCRRGAARGLPGLLPAGSRPADRRPGRLPAPRQRGRHAEGEAPAAGGGPVPVDVPGRWPHPRACSCSRCRMPARTGRCCARRSGCSWRPTQ